MSTARPVVVVSRFLPDPGAWAASRILHAFVTGARALGRDVTVWSWWPYDAAGPVPDWVRWDRLPTEPLAKVKARALLRPRHDVDAVGWRLPEGVIAIAEDSLSFPAVRRHPRSVLTMHYSTALDRRALGSVRAKDLQDLRFERSIARRAVVSTAFSQRVADSLRPRGVAVPVAYDVPAEPLPAAGDEPIAVCVADWTWPPNRTALDRLLAAWPLVRAQVPHAELLLAGRGPAPSDPQAGVTALGWVPDSVDVLARAAVMVFPTADTSGPKVKVMEAVSLGVPVVTTPAGVEGLALRDGAVVTVPQPAPPQDLAAAIVAVLRDPDAARGRAYAAREDLARHHAPTVAAQRRLDVIDAALAER